MEQICSVNNDKIKFAVKLASSSKVRKQSGLFFLEGLRLCLDAHENKVEIDQVFISDTSFKKWQNQLEDLLSSAQKVYIVNEAVSKKLSLTQSSQGIFCLAKMREDQDEKYLNFNSKYIALDNLQDPSNLGAIARTSEALGIEGIIMQNCCDIYNPKALRAAMGSLSRIMTFTVESLVDIIEVCKKNGMKVYSTTPDENALEISNVDFSGGTICIIGNEGNGVSEEVFNSSEKITISMLGRAESLNAATAATITMWEMIKNGR